MICCAFPKNNFFLEPAIQQCNNHSLENSTIHLHHFLKNSTVHLQAIEILVCTNASKISNRTTWAEMLTILSDKPIAHFDEII